MFSLGDTKSWLRRTPRIVLALALVVPLLFCEIEFWHGPVVYIALLLLLQSAIYIAGGFQRCNWRQVIGLAILGMVVRVTKLPIDIDLPSLECRIWHPALTIMILGATESFLTCGKKSVCLAWTLIVCLGAAAVFDVFEFGLLLRYPSIHFPSVRGTSIIIPITSITYWPLLAITAWSAIPMGILAAQRKNFIRPLYACVTVGCMLGFFGFYRLSLFSDAVQSMQGRGPFPRSSGVGLLGFRANQEDLEVIWNAMLEGKEQENPDLPGLQLGAPYHSIPSANTIRIKWWNGWQSG